ncbi:MAG: amidohydrolase family protein [Defluviicoccus sp.]|nr:amidohydrolase family protein [Defluviicoccus sp.]
MKREKRTVIPGRWVLAGTDDGPEIVEDRYVVVEGSTIAAIAGERPADADETIEFDQALVLPGFVNIHNHSFSAPVFRGLIEDVSEATLGGNYVYSFLLPMGEMAVDVLDRDEQRAIVEIAVLELIMTGSTTILDMWRINQDFFFDVARRMGIRAYGCPYQWSSASPGVDADGRPVYGGTGADTGLARAIEMFQRYDEGPDGRVRVGLAPHGVDTCAPDLLREVRAAATDLGCPISIHVSQSPLEVDTIRARYGKTSVEHLRDLGFLGPDVVVGHCIYATDADLAILRDAGTAVATCPLTYARVGVTAPYHRFRESGVGLGIGTDGYCLDMLSEFRTSGLLAKTHSGRGDAGSAFDLISAATKGGAAALGREDLGVIAPGAKADLIVVDMRRPHLFPVWDPLRALVWNGSGADVSAVMVDGEILVRDGRFLRGDADDIMDRAGRALEKLWSIAAARGLLKRWPRAAAGG